MFTGATPDYRVEVSRDGSRLLSFGSYVSLWDTRKTRLINTPVISTTRDYCVKFSPDSTKFAWVNEYWNEKQTQFGPQVSIGDARAGQTMRICRGAPYKANDGAMALQWSPNGREIYVASWDLIDRLDAQSGKTLARVRFRHTVWPDATPALAFSPDVRVLARSGETGVSLFDVQTGKLLRTLAAQSGYILFFSPDSTLLGIYEWTGGVGYQIYRVADGKKLWKWMGAGAGPLVWMPDSRQVSRSNQKECVVRDAQTGQEVGRRPFPRADAFDFSPSGDFVYEISKQGKITAFPFTQK